jgi:hypothetical protein
VTSPPALVLKLKGTGGAAISGIENCKSGTVFKINGIRSG